MLSQQPSPHFSTYSNPAQNLHTTSQKKPTQPLYSSSVPCRHHPGNPPTPPNIWISLSASEPGCQRSPRCQLGPRRVFGVSKVESQHQVQNIYGSVTHLLDLLCTTLSSLHRHRPLNVRAVNTQRLTLFHVVIRLGRTAFINIDE